MPGTCRRAIGVRVSKLYVLDFLVPESDGWKLAWDAFEKKKLGGRSSLLT